MRIFIYLSLALSHAAFAELGTLQTSYPRCILAKTIGEPCLVGYPEKILVEFTGENKTPRSYTEAELIHFYVKNGIATKTEKNELKFKDCKTDASLTAGKYCMDEGELQVFKKKNEWDPASDELQYTLEEAKLIDTPGCGIHCGRCDQAIQQIPLSKVINFQSPGVIDYRKSIANGYYGSTPINYKSKLFLKAKAYESKTECIKYLPTETSELKDAQTGCFSTDLHDRVTWFTIKDARGNDIQKCQSKERRKVKYRPDYKYKTFEEGDFAIPTQKALQR